MLKDNADDIKEKLSGYKRLPIMDKIIAECKPIIDKYGDVEKQLFAPRKIDYKELKKLADHVFIALHGRPGEDGTVQTYLNKLKIPYNGSGVESSKITINKYDTNEFLKKHKDRPACEISSTMTLGFDAKSIREPLASFFYSHKIASAYDETLTLAYSPLTAKPPLHPATVKVTYQNDKAIITRPSKLKQLRSKIINQPIRRPASSSIPV
jgi:hypothetical protein